MLLSAYAIDAQRSRSDLPISSFAQRSGWLWRQTIACSMRSLMIITYLSYDQHIYVYACMQCILCHMRMIITIHPNQVITALGVHAWYQEIMDKRVCCARRGSMRSGVMTHMTRLPAVVMHALI